MAALYSHPVQYTAPLFRELSSRSGVDLTVYFLSRQGLDVSFDPQFGKSFSWDIPLLEGYRHKFLPNVRRTHAVNGFFKLSNTSVIDEIRRHRYDALLVHGYEHFSKWMAFLAAKTVGTRMILRGESHLNAPRGVIRRAIKRLVLRRLFRTFSAVTYIGTLNRQYFEHYGVPPERLHFAPYSVDNAFFRETAPGPRRSRAEVRKSLGIDDNSPIILQLGKLTEVKQPELLLEAFSRVRKLHACHLVYVGDGALRTQIQARVIDSGLRNVHITGFVNQSRVPEMLSCADLLVLPSRVEPWGLAVNEAMAAGLPVIVSDQVGCSLDLISEGQNGYTVSCTNADQLAERIAQLVANPELRRSCGARSADLIQAWSVQKTADGIIAAARSVQAKP